MTLMLKRKTFALGIVVVIGMVVLTMNYTGYCLTAGRILADDEKIRVAIGYLLKKYPPAAISTPTGPRTWTITRPATPVHYRDVDEFLALNPGCCQITEWGEPVEAGKATSIERASGTLSSYLHIKYQVRYLEGNAIESVIYADHVPISNCGKPARAIEWQSAFQRFIGLNPANLFD